MQIIRKLKICEIKVSQKFRTYSNPSSSSIQNLKPQACFCDCTGEFVSNLVKNLYCWFSHMKGSSQKTDEKFSLHLTSDMLTCL